MWNCLFEEIRVWCEISIKYCNELVVFDIVTAHRRLQIPSLVACPDRAMSIDDVHAPLAPLGDLGRNQELNQLVVRVVENLNQQTVSWPIDLARGGNRLLVHLQKSIDQTEAEAENYGTDRSK